MLRVVSSKVFGALKFSLTYQDSKRLTKASEHISRLKIDTLKNIRASLLKFLGLKSSHRFKKGQKKGKSRLKSF